MARPQYLYIPVEVKVRELQAKILLALEAVERGYRVVLGEAHALRNRLHQSPAGIVLEKGVAPSAVESFAGFKSLGHRVISWCEEGLVFFNDDDYVRRKIAGNDLLEVDYFCAWGPYQATVIAGRYPEVADRMVCTGNVRMDLLRAEFRGIFAADADRLREQYGKYILINSNFQHCNHRRGEDGYVELIQQSGRIDSEEAEQFTRGWIAHKKRLFEAFLCAIERVQTAFPDYRIVIRPHPGENHDTWREKLGHLPNIEVTHEGGVTPWVLAAAVLIHNGCTTGIESFLLNKPAIAYRPYVSEVYDQYLPNSVNYQADDEDALLSALQTILHEGDVKPFVGQAAWRSVLEQHLVGFGETSACAAILDLVDQIEPPRDLNRRPWFPLHRLSLKGYFAAHTLAYRVIRGRQDRGDYSRQKFPGATKPEIENRIAELQHVSGRFGGVGVESLAKDVFLLSGRTA